MDNVAASKSDIHELKIEFKADIAELKAELRAEFKTDIAGLREELKADINELRTEIAKINGKLALLYWMMGFLLTCNVAIIMKLFIH